MGRVEWVPAFVVVALGCARPPPVVPEPEPPEQGVVVASRTPDGEPETAVRVYLGGGDAASPDVSGFVYYVDVTPGRTQVSVELAGHATGHGAPHVEPDALSAVTVVPLALELVDVPDVSVPVVIQGDGLTVEIPGGATSDPWTAGWQVVDTSERYSVPGDLQGLYDDVDVLPIVTDWIGVVRGTTEDDDVSFVEDTRILVTAALPAGSPLLAADAVAHVYQYSGSRTYWVHAGIADIDADALTATFDVGNLGWWALGREVIDRSCVSGRVTGPTGVGIEGAEVRLYQEGLMGVDRTSTEGGTFCLPIDPDAAGELRIVGFDTNRQHLYTWDGAVQGGAIAACGGGCVDLGTLEAAEWADVDGDRSWSGPGGDCDDGDPDVNPNPTTGDGSYCGGVL